MAIIKAYTTEIKLEAFLNIAITSGEADDAINQAVDIIDQLTGRNFIADSVASVRLFNGNAQQDLPIDDCVSISKVEVGDNGYGDTFTEITEGGSDGYYLYPNNYSARSLPIRAIHLRSRVWIAGWANQRITAKWGYSTTVPQAIAFATTVLASGIYMYNRGGASGGIKSEKIGNYSVSYSSEEGWKAYKDALTAIGQYRRLTI